MFQVKVNDQHQFEIQVDNNQLKVNKEIVNVDAVTLSNGHSHVIYKDQSYNVEIIEHQPEEKTVTVKVNGNLYTVAVEDQYDLLLKQLGMDNLQTQQLRDSKAPMPGLVLNILVTVGQEVHKGDNLVILEAMKMENIIKSTSTGIVKAISVTKGDKVEKNAVLIQFS
ncbi:biotin/lipoyl-containing protein [Pedobacter sp.]|uniref:acetyl-CoA carboxylase biotin carboxyl carrier protein subunit n=1 Tax=Pedobacter sp. TaxID=1411316 RepID=UPI003D7FAD3E